MVTFQGINSVIDRTVFTNKGPIVKTPLSILVGTDLEVISQNVCCINSGSFDSSFEGKILKITGSDNFRNDGEFVIEQVLNPKSLKLKGSNFSNVNEDLTFSEIFNLANTLKNAYNEHRIGRVDNEEENPIHGTDDIVNVVTAPNAIDELSCYFLLNELKTKLSLHFLDISGDPKVHEEIDDQIIYLPNAINLPSALNLVNELRKVYEVHRVNQVIHQNPDLGNAVGLEPAVAVRNVVPGGLTGPFNWEILEPRYGEVADSPEDVNVNVAGSPATVEAVFGLLGAAVLTNKPNPGESVDISYNWMQDPPSQFLRLNSYEFNLNQGGSRGYGGLEDHRHIYRTHLISPGVPYELVSPNRPKQIHWKYKGYERAYSALLNDPTSLLLNVPTNKISYPVLSEMVSEETISYDPVVFPQNLPDPWNYRGSGTLSLPPGQSQLVIVDNNDLAGSSSNPPFFTKTISITVPSVVSGSFRLSCDDDASLTSDGVFTGVSFGFSDGTGVVTVGLLKTNATNLSSSISLINDMKEAFNLHIESGVYHNPTDPISRVSIVDATDLESAIILANELKRLFNIHVDKGGDSLPTSSSCSTTPDVEFIGFVHILKDTINVINSPDASDLSSLQSLVNELFEKFNNHREQDDIHFNNDVDNEVILVRQVGILLNSSFPEFIESWKSEAIDWTGFRTFRIFRQSNGDVQVFESGAVSPFVEAERLELPRLADLPVEFNFSQFVFFGSTSDEAQSISRWQFVRVVVSPVESVTTESNKQVEYDGSVLPERDVNAPWAVLGAGGYEQVLLGDILLVDDLASASASLVDELGDSTGSFRGYTRIEPVLTINSTSIVEFNMRADYYTHSLDNSSLCVVLDDSRFSTQLCFLQFSPTPATSTSAGIEPYPIILGDDFNVEFEGQIYNIVFDPNIDGVTASSISAKINSVIGTTFASDDNGSIRLESQSAGSDSFFRILSGWAVSRLGFSTGTIRGSDSISEPRISWFGANIPDFDDPFWIRVGDQSDSLLGNVLRISDTNPIDYLLFNLSNRDITENVFNRNNDWKANIRIAVRSFVAGDTVSTSGPFLTLSNVGPFISIDEGNSGKNLQLSLAVDNLSNPYINLLSFNSTTNELVVIAQFAFSWNDGGFHTFSVYTDKNANSLFVFADGVLLTPLAGNTNYSSFLPGFSDPELSFGSGSEPVGNSDLRQSQSIVDWDSVSIVKDSKVSDPSSSLNRFIGIWNGGDPGLLSSYRLHQIDWKVSHVYRILRDPLTSVNVYVDGGNTPVISIPYQLQFLPDAGKSPLASISNKSPLVAWGSFNPQEIVRSRWEFFNYAIGRITLTNLLVPQNHVLNKANVIASPEHLRTKEAHIHFGTKTWSGGTPTDEFMTNEFVDAFTILNEGTPPVPMTQNLESRSGLIKTGTEVNGIPSVDIINASGFLSDFQDDTFNDVENFGNYSSFISSLISLSNSLKISYNAHESSAVFHLAPGVLPSTAPNASDLPTAITLLNDIRSNYNNHLVSLAQHDPADDGNLVSSPIASDADSAAILANEILEKFNSHIGFGQHHINNDSINTVPVFVPNSPLTAALLSDLIAESFVSHGLNSNFHLKPDLANASARRLSVSSVFEGKYNDFTKTVETTASLSIGDKIQWIEGPNSGASITVTSISSPNVYVTDPQLFLSHTTLERFVRLDSLNQPILNDANTIAITNIEAERINAHFIEDSVHKTNDVQFPFTNGPAVRIEETYDILSHIVTEWNSHLSGTFVHQISDEINFVSEDPVITPLQDSISFVNSLLQNYNKHLSQHKVHLANDTENFVSLEDATDESSAIVLANSLKFAFNNHLTATIRETQKVHSEDDSVNAISSPDATDLESLNNLLSELSSNYNAHLVQPTVHSSTLFIRLDPPSRVLYSCMKFFTSEQGDSQASIYPFCDSVTGEDDSFTYHGSTRVILRKEK